MTKGLDINLKGRYVLKGRGGSQPILRVEVKNSGAAEIRSRMAAAISRASAVVAVDLKAALDEAIRSDVWQTTKGRADIVETGELLRSGSVIITSNEIKIVYDAPYAGLVHYGGYILPYGNESRDKVYLPPRPWVDAVLNGTSGIAKFDFDRYYRKAIEDEFR